MLDKTIPSLITIPIEIVYRIFDYLEVENIILSARNVCQRLDNIIDTYQPYQVEEWQFISNRNFYWVLIFINKVLYPYTTLILLSE